MKNIMLIAAATLTIATANAQHWDGVSPIQVVNNTNVQLEFRTWPSGQYFTLQPNTSTYVTNAGDTQLFSGWGVDDTGAGTVVWKPVFDGNENDSGTMTEHTAYISKNITQGQAWDIVNVGYNDKLVFTGTASGNTMPLTATKTEGITVLRTDENEASGEAFCLDTDVAFPLAGDQSSERCPIGETRVVLANIRQLMNNNTSIDDWDADDLAANVYAQCTYTGGCSVQWADGISGDYLTGFATVPYSISNNNHVEVTMQGG